MRRSDDRSRDNSSNPRNSRETTKSSNNKIYDTLIEGLPHDPKEKNDEFCRRLKKENAE